MMTENLFSINDLLYQANARRRPPGGRRAKLRLISSVPQAASHRMMMR
jgi:hypothetical protein